MDYLYVENQVSIIFSWSKLESSQTYKFMLLYNIERIVQKSIQIKSRSGPCNIAVTAGGDLVYNYYYDSSVNIVKSSRVHTKVRFDFWRISTYIYILSALYNNKWLQGWGIRGIVRTRYCFSNSVCHCKLIFVFLDW